MMDDTTHEEWRPVVGYEGLYEVSNMGRVKTLRKRGGNLMKLSRLWSGYYSVRLTKDGQAKGFYVHRLVMASFVGLSELQVNHKDSQRHNNCLSNLEYVSRERNMEHMRETQRTHPRPKWRGSWFRRRLSEGVGL